MLYSISSDLANTAVNVAEIYCSAPVGSLKGRFPCVGSFRRARKKKNGLALVIGPVGEMWKFYNKKFRSAVIGVSLGPWSPRVLLHLPMCPAALRDSKSLIKFACFTHMVSLIGTVFI